MSRPKNIGLTDRERRAYAAICSYIKEHSYPPTLREIGELADITSLSSVHAALRVLQREGMIEVAPGSPRALRVVE